MSLQTWNELLYSSVTDATQISNSTTETIMVPDTNLPEKYWYPSRTVKATLIGNMSNVATTPGTLTLRARFGGVAGTVLAASAALALSTTARTAANFWIEFFITCRAAGWSTTAGTLRTSGRCCLGLSASVSGRVDNIPDISNADVASLDLRSASVLSFTAQFSVSTSPTNLRVDQFLFEAMN